MNDARVIDPDQILDTEAVQVDSEQPGEDLAQIARVREPVRVEGLLVRGKLGPLEREELAQELEGVLELGAPEFWRGSMRLTHKITVFSHKLCTF